MFLVRQQMQVFFLFVELRYDTIRYVCVRLKVDEMASLVQRTARKRKIRRTKTKTD